MSIWDITTPLGTESKSLGDDRIREAKAAIQNALLAGQANGVEAIFPGANPSTNPLYRPRFPKGTTGARPASGEYGFYINETTKTIDRDNGSSWEAVATLIPPGTVSIFYQATAPLGWTQIVTQNDKALRVVSAAGGGTGGTIATSTTLAHSHTANAHTHVGGSHKHYFYYELVNIPFSQASPNTMPNSFEGESKDSDGNDDYYRQTRNGGSSQNNIRQYNKPQTLAASSGTTGTQSDSGMSSALAGALAYIDVIICSKD